MKTQVNKIISDVKYAINEIDPNQALFIGDKDNANLETRIQSRIEATADHLHKTTPADHLKRDAAITINYDGTDSDTRLIYRRKNGMLILLLNTQAADFQNVFDIDPVRMLEASSKHWPYKVCNVVYPDDPLYEIVTDPYVGAQPEMPAVTYNRRRISKEGNVATVTTIELRYLTEPTDWASVTLIPRAKIQEGYIDIDQAIYHQLIDDIAKQIMIEP